MSAPLLEDVLDAAIDTWLEDVMVSQVAIVTTFNADNHTVSAQPICKKKQEREDGQIVFKDQPVIQNIPVYYMGSGNNRATFTVAKGSLVVLLHLNQIKDAWLYSKGAGTVQVTDERRHHYSDCIAIPGVLTRGQTSEDNARVDAGWVFHTDDKIKLGGGNTEPVIRQSDLKAAIKGAVSDPGVVSAINLGTGVGTAIDTYFSTHDFGSDVVEAE